ncbi:MAG: hypothetical protein FJZ01_02110 [Candidatus Sericytochromatia bacterium]|nr:hypothetical protein [Candidatus Tanganyikabacteria bacterium]
MRQNNRLSWSLALAIGIPVLALTGCPGLVGGTGPSPTPGATTAATTAPTTAPTTAATTAPTTAPATRKTGLLVKVDIPSTGDRTISIKNNGTAAEDLSKWALCYEYKDSTGIKMVHARLASGSADATFSLAAGAEIAVSESTVSTGVHVKLDQAGLGSSTGVNKLGIQAGHGAVALFKGVSASTDLTSANLLDYVQYGNLTQSANSSNYVHAQLAVDAKVWESLTATASAPAVAGKAIKVITVGASGSANWTVQ